MRLSEENRSLRSVCADLCLILTIAVGGPAAAQDVAVGQATATVVATITVTTSADLTFGSVLQGVRKTIANNNTAAAVFGISGQTDAGVNLTLMLPEYMSLSDGSARMQISFGATGASIDTTGAGDPTGMGAGDGWQNVNPRNLPAAATIGSSGTDIYLGGSVTPSANQQAGSYTGDVVLTVAYNGT